MLGFLETLARQVVVAIDGIQVFHQLQQSLNEHQVAQDATTENWSRLLEMRGLEPGGNLQRITIATLNLAQRMGIDDKKLANVIEGDCCMILEDCSCQFHFQKAWSINPRGIEISTIAPGHAHMLLSRIAPFRSALSIPYCHHEYWDESGYARA